MADGEAGWSSAGPIAPQEVLAKLAEGHRTTVLDARRRPQKSPNVIRCKLSKLKAIQRAAHKRQLACSAKGIMPYMSPTAQQFVRHLDWGPKYDELVLVLVDHAQDGADALGLLNRLSVRHPAWTTTGQAAWASSYAEHVTQREPVAKRSVERYRGESLGEASARRSRLGPLIALVVLVVVGVLSWALHSWITH